MSFKDYLGKVHEMEFLRFDAFGGTRYSMGHLRLWSDDRGSGLLNFVFDDIEKDCILNGLSGRGEFFDSGAITTEYMHLYGANDRQQVVFDAYLINLKSDGMLGLHLHGKYGYRGMPIQPMTRFDIPAVPVNIHDKERIAAVATDSEVRSKRGDEGSTIVGSGWIGN